jgi:tRNA G18 (ribose-2'-O)-methylase SpoU
MPRIPIEDLDDPRIAVYRSLKATNRTRDLGQFVVEGERLVDRLIDSRFPVVSVLIDDRFEGKLTRPIPEDVPAYIVPHAMVDQVVGFPFHRGILACGQRRPWPALETLVAGAERPFFAVICPKLSNPENLGALARIGDVFGIDAILAGPECPDPLSRRVLRVSMGAALRLPVIVEERLTDAAARLADSAGFELIAAVADPDAIPFENVRRPQRLGLVLGDEHEGIDANWLALCRRAVTIPMRPGASSLNVAVAAGILVYHYSR